MAYACFNDLTNFVGSIAQNPALVCGIVAGGVIITLAYKAAKVYRSKNISHQVL